MISIDADLQRAASGATTWSSKAAHDVAAKLAQEERANIDWDDGAGERWLRIVNTSHASALISIVLPLVLVERRASRSADSIQSVTKVFVDDLDSVELSCSPEVLAEVFGSPERFNVIDPAGFSANDLWYATV